jgi:hypothetical protein
MPAPGIDAEFYRIRESSPGKTKLEALREARSVEPSWRTPDNSGGVMAPINKTR